MAKLPKRPSKTKPSASKKPAMRGKTTTAKSSKDRAVDTGQTYLVFGSVTNADTTPAAGLTVIAYDKDESREDRLGQVTTDATGAYEIPYSAAAFRRSMKERGGADVIVRVYSDQNELLFTSKKKNSAPADYQLNIQLPTQPYVVRGTVRDADGKPLHNVVVRAYDQDLRRRQKMGEGSTDREGRYRIAYSQSAFCRAEKDGADLVAVVFDADDVELSRSSVLFNAPPSVTVDLTIPAEVLRPTPLFEKLGLVLEPLLEGLRVEELEEDQEHQDLSFLFGDTGFEKATLARFVLAHRLAQQGVRAEFWFVLLGSSFYQFSENQSLKEQFAAVLDALSSIDAAAVRKALARGFNQQEISEEFRDNVAGWIEAFLKLVARRSVSGSGEPTFVKAALEHANITGAEKQEVFARLFNEYKALTPELLDALGKDRSFKKAEIDDLQASFRLAELTQADFSVVKMLKDEFDVRQPEKIRNLAKMSEREWVSLVKEKHACGVIKLPAEKGEATGPIQAPVAELYGKRLERQFREAFPTTAFSGGLERAMENGGAKGLKRPADVHRLMDRYPEFELLNTPVDDFLNKNIDPDFQELAKDEHFRQEVKAVQRVFKLAPTFEATDAMLADGMHSAQMAYRMGESEFVRSYGKRLAFTPEAARATWNRAADTYAAALTLTVTYLSPEILQGLMGGYKYTGPAPFPNWNNLFQAGDICECEHCRSVLSPAAYFADLLMFLKDRKAKDPSNTVKDILFKRRADLGFLELNCANALTPFPYIDGVCEVLEDAVDAHNENDLELIGLTAIPFNPEAAKAAVIQAFKNAFADPVNTGKEKIGLGANLSISQVSPLDPDLWMVHSEDVTYLLKKKSTPNFFAELVRNTKASLAELRAYPQYVNPKAYNKLREAKYPLDLPFDLFGEEVKAAFQKTNLKRWDLMRTMRSAAAPDNPTNGEIAAEYFGISTDASAAFDEKRLILVADTTVAGQQAVWGVAGTSSLNTVGNVKIFLQKTGLGYNELLALLDLKFINPTGAIVIKHLDASCDTDKKVIEGLDDPTKLDRIHRFLRLSRKLKGWKMWELDLVIRQSGVGDKSSAGEWLLNETFLINLFYFSQLRTRLGEKATVEQVCALFGNLSTETRFTKLHEKRDVAIYQNLFLNKRLINPLNPAFQLDPTTGDLQVGKTLSDPEQIPVIIAALGIHEADLILFKELTKTDGTTRYITDDLTLGNLSFLWRHVWLSKLLKFKSEEWKTILKLFQQDIVHFSTPEAAWKFVERIDHLKATGFTPDELNWLLAADRSEKTAAKESDAAKCLFELRKVLQAIRSEYDASKYDFLIATPPTDEEQLAGLLTTLLQKLNRDEAGVSFFIATLQGDVAVETKVAGLPANFNSLPAIAAIPIRYDATNQILHFRGIMTIAQQATLRTDPSLPIVDPAYLDAVDELFGQPRLAVKFYDPVFTALLKVLPPAVDFKAQLSAELAGKISYDPEQRWLRFTGMMSNAEKTQLIALSVDGDYITAVNSLAAQPQTPPSDKPIWLTDTDLDQPSSVATNTLAKRMANAAMKALGYLSQTLAANAVVQQSSAQLGLPEALTRSLLEDCPVMPPIPPDTQNATLLAHITRIFAVTSVAVDYASPTMKSAFDGWFWANRAAAILRKWKLTLAEWKKIIALTAGAQLLDLRALPLDATGAIAPIDRFIRTSRLLRLRDSLPETGITFLEVLEKLSAGAYTTAAEFSSDVQRLNDAWLAADVEALTTSFDLVYPDDYLLAESWERLGRAFYFLASLNVGADTAKTFADAGMSDTHAKTIKELLRSKFGTETWLTLSAEIQDVLRERKRDALAAYLLTHPLPDPKPADAPSGKWENTNDLYAYFLLDVEMSSCQLTSRLVQASGSVQLFVQRCFMGLEPEVVAQADGDKGDSAWRWWKWMRKYQVWAANRKVFLWPENWIEPELKKDRSSFFKDMENELLQNEINQYTAETALSNYLEKLGGVAQLEIAGFFQEDDGDNAIVHVFGRTAGAEPHLYYYRRYDYRQWTPWEKVELDIQGDYLIPAVVNKRLFLFWPVFTEVPDEAKNISAMRMPTTGGGSFTPDRVQKRLKLQMAVSEYRQGKWTPKKVSTDFSESKPYDLEIVRKHYRFFLIDRRREGGDFCISYDGYSLGNQTTIDALNAVTLKNYETQIDAATRKRDDAARDRDKALMDRDAASTNHRIASDEYDEIERYLAYLNDLKSSILALSIPRQIEALKNLGVLKLDNVLEGVLQEALNLERKVEEATGPAKDALKVALAIVLVPLGILFVGGSLIALEVLIGDTRGTLSRAETKRDEAWRVLDPAQKALDQAQGKLNEAQIALNNIPLPTLEENKLLAWLSGAFKISGCKGVPEKGDSFGNAYQIFRPDQDSVGLVPSFQKWRELPPRPNVTPQDDLTLVSPIQTTVVLGKTPDLFEISLAWHLSHMDMVANDFHNSHAPIYYEAGMWLPFFYGDRKRTFFVLPSSQFDDSGVSSRGYYPRKKSYVEERLSHLQTLSSTRELWQQLAPLGEFHFKNFYHPVVCYFAELVYNPLKGIPALMSRDTQLKSTGFSFQHIYQPTQAVVKLPPQYPSLPDCYPNEVVDFSPDGAYSSYNWELFFHAPLLIASSLSKNQRFEEARDWYHFIFNPLGVESPSLGGSPVSKYWITKPFFDATKPYYAQQRIDNVLRMLAGDVTAPGYSSQAKKDLEDQVLDWRTNPFEPHRIANYRTVAYQKTVVMKYLDNLIAWGDNLFRQDSMESINEATQLYILAAEILGPRPKRIPPHAMPPVESFNELENEFDRFSNALVEVENLVPPMSGNGKKGADPAPLPMLYFCIPQNDKMLGYWDTVADRLYKIHHCMNIEGVVRQLALFEPPIDPGLLVKAVGAGIDVSSALADLNAPLPLYRFNVLLQKANEVCSDVKALGGALLAALEKKDAEAMGLLRQSQEIHLLEAVKTVREKQIEEAKENLEGLKKSKVVMETRRDYYRDIEKLIAGEQLSLNKLETAHTHQNKAQEINIAASVLGYLPNVTIGASGFGGSPHVNVQWGTGNIISALQAASGSEIQLSNIASYAANRAATLAGYDRRFSDWKLQETLAERELPQIDKQIASAELRIAIAEKELENHVLQIEKAKATDDFMRSKYTNQELYQWQVGQISGVYFQSYKLAYDLAKRAERCFRFELGLQDSSYINFGYWDSLKKGLLSGEKLQYDLRRLETAYLEQNRREFELTKHVSLVLLDPLALVKLRETGRCFFRLPEELFDLDYPGHYFRRIKSVSVTLPCVTGPYTTVSCTLRLLKNYIRINTTLANGYTHAEDERGVWTDDPRFVESNIPVKAIAASNAQNDSGVFELSFRDERYVPFEGAGAVSEWALELFSDLPANNPDPTQPDFGRPLRQFDYGTIADAVVHIKYTAREDAGPFKNAAIKHLREYFERDGAVPSLRLFNLRQEFPTQWHRFLHPANAADGNVLELEMASRLFSIRDQGQTLKVNTIWFLARCTDAGTYDVVMTPPLPAPPPSGSNKMSLPKLSEYGGLHVGQMNVATLGIEVVPAVQPIKWRLKMTRPGGGNLQVGELEDVLLVLGYEWQ